MYPVSSVFGRALREAHTLAVRVDAWYDGDLLIEDLPLDEDSAGQVTVQAGTGVRRQLDLTIADAGLWDDLDVTGIELRPYRGIRYPSGQVELVPLGVFGLAGQSMSVGPDGGIRIGTAPDRWARVQRARFETPAASQVGDLVVDEIVRLVTEAVPDVEVSVLSTSTVTVGALVWDRDRDKAVVDLATGIGAEVYFDNDGVLIVRDAPTLSQAPVWTVDASPSGVLLGGDLRRDRSRTYNVVVVSDARTDGSTPFAPQVIEDDDPSSPTYVGGPFGRVPYFWSSPTVRSAPQAVIAGTTILNRVRAVNAQLDLDAVVNPALDRGDVIEVLTTTGRVERHLIDALTVPLTVSGVQSITTRSSRPDGDEE
jgi:hypothetical protein